LRARSRAAARPAALRVGVSQALAQYWLIRRLPSFVAAHRDVLVEIIYASTEAQARAADVDAQILWLPMGVARSTSTQRLLFEESVFPVAAPRWLPDGRPLADVAALASLPILHKGPAGQQDGAEWSWTTWFERLGLGIKVPEGLRFDAISMSMAAAIEGAGLAIARSLLAHDALAERRLCRVLSSEWDIASTKVHVIRWPAVLSGDVRIASFNQWLADHVSAMRDVG
jgi:LysR family transcriptional regulator, glycine cleavage system transcriptional activator